MGNLTKHFSVEEFNCRCGCTMPANVLENVKELAEELQVLRHIVESPMTINSAYRCPSHNKAVGGARRSQHLLGTASDLVVSGKSPSSLHELISSLIDDEVIREGGLGKYNTFTHYDIRGNKARW